MKKPKAESGKRKKAPPPSPQSPAPDPRLLAPGIRDRVVDFRRVKASELRANPKNWRTHPDSQRQVLSSVLREVGFVDACIARQLPDGSLELIDGHLRTEMLPEAMVPVLVVDVSEHEAQKVLLTLDPLAGLAEADTANLDFLLRAVATSEQELATFFTALAEDHGLDPFAAAEEDPSEASRDAKPLDATFQLVLTAETEEQQRTLFEEFQGRGIKVRLLTI